MSACACSFDFVVFDISSYTKRYVKLAIGYELSPGVFTRETSLQSPLGSGNACATFCEAADIESKVGSTNAVPSPFCTYAYDMPVWNAYASSTYPIVYSVLRIIPATPSLPAAPCVRAGHCTLLPFPTATSNSELTAVR